MSCEIRCGKLGRNAVDECAERAARAISERGSDKATAVCVGPDGLVTVEATAYAIEEDIVGVYDRRPGWIELWRVIKGDLLCVARERRINIKTRNET